MNFEIENTYYKDSIIMFLASEWPKAGELVNKSNFSEIIICLVGIHKLLIFYII